MAADHCLKTDSLQLNQMKPDDPERKTEIKSKIEDVYQVEELLLVSGAIAAESKDTLVKHRINAVVNLCPPRECTPCVEGLGIEYCHKPIEDGNEKMLAKILDDTISFIDRHLSAGHKVLVHCSQGKSRSVSVAIAFLIVKRKKTVLEALLQLRTARRDVEPDSAYRQTLINLEKKRTGQDVAMKCNSSCWDPACTCESCSVVRCSRCL